MSDVREKVRERISAAAATFSCLDTAAEKGFTKKDEAQEVWRASLDDTTDQILALLPLGVEVRGLTSDERQRLADLRATDFAPGSDQAFLLSLLDRPALPTEPSEEAVEAMEALADAEAVLSEDMKEEPQCGGDPSVGHRVALEALRAAYAAETGVTSRSSGNRAGRDEAEEAVEADSDQRFLLDRLEAAEAVCDAAERIVRPGLLRLTFKQFEDLEKAFRGYQSFISSHTPDSEGGA